MDVARRNSRFRRYRLTRADPRRYRQAWQRLRFAADRRGVRTRRRFERSLNRLLEIAVHINERREPTRKQQFDWRASGKRGIGFVHPTIRVCGIAEHGMQGVKDADE